MNYRNMEILNITITAYLYYGKLCEAEELKNLFAGGQYR
ncbi:MAG: hypothetical protein BAJALOKI1v1_260001 [Promethearchaeota archaeon]|nr:MAG: hypothetical protein BAJALOKI1v1_730009 [Candidatus Lokiarchaeota archaeon]TXT66703.1 MAG: hypothetical protein BAJALOKI1v1_260001 [Candidatus Lokiarchaeota archaeon]